MSICRHQIRVMMVAASLVVGGGTVVTACVGTAVTTHTIDGFTILTDSSCQGGFQGWGVFEFDATSKFAIDNTNPPPAGSYASVAVGETIEKNFFGAGWVKEYPAGANISWHSRGDVGCNQTYTWKQVVETRQSIPGLCAYPPPDANHKYRLTHYAGTGTFNPMTKVWSTQDSKVMEL